MNISGEKIWKVVREALELLRWPGRKFLKFFEKVTQLFTRFAHVTIALSIFSIPTAIVFGLLYWRSGGQAYLYKYSALVSSVLSLWFATISVWGQFPSAMRFRRIVEETADVLIGWDQYIKRSAELYLPAKEIHSIVTEWEIDSRLEYALVNNKRLKEGIFVGEVKRGHHFFGVVWRLNVIAKSKKEQNYQVFCYKDEQLSKEQPKYLIIEDDVVIPRERTEKPDDFIACIYPVKGRLYEIFQRDFKGKFIDEKAKNLKNAEDEVKKIVEDGQNTIYKNTHKDWNTLLSWLMGGEIDDAMRDYHKGSYKQLLKDFGEILREFVDRHDLNSVSEPKGETGNAGEKKKNQAPEKST